MIWKYWYTLSTILEIPRKNLNILHQPTVVLSRAHIQRCISTYVWRFDFCVSIKNFHSCSNPCNSLFDWILHTIETMRCFKILNDLNELVSIQFCESSNYKSCEWGSTSRQRRTTWKNKTEPLYSSRTSWGFLAKVRIREWTTEFSVSDTRYEMIHI